MSGTLGAAARLALFAVAPTVAWLAPTPGFSLWRLSQEGGSPWLLAVLLVALYLAAIGLALETAGGAGPRWGRAALAALVLGGMGTELLGGGLFQALLADWARLGSAAASFTFWSGIHGLFGFLALQARRFRSVRPALLLVGLAAALLAPDRWPLPVTAEGARISAGLLQDSSDFVQEHRLSGPVLAQPGLEASSVVRLVALAMAPEATPAQREDALAAVRSSPERGGLLLVWQWDLLLALGREEEAAALLREAAVEAPRQLVAHYAALLLDLRGDPAALRSLYDVEGTLLAYHQRLPGGARERWERARRSVAGVMPESPPPAVACLEAMDLDRQGRRREALALLEGAVPDLPGPALEALLRLFAVPRAYVWELAPRLAEHAPPEALEEALDVPPPAPPAEELAGALDSVRRARALSPNPRFLLMEAALERRLGRPLPPYEAFLAALRGAPSDSLLGPSLGELALAGGYSKRLLEDLEGPPRDALRIMRLTRIHHDPAAPRADLEEALADVRAHALQPEAVSRFETALALSPELAQRLGFPAGRRAAPPSRPVLLADLALRLGRRTEALEDLRRLLARESDAQNVDFLGTEVASHYPELLESVAFERSALQWAARRLTERPSERALAWATVLAERAVAASASRDYSSLRDLAYVRLRAGRPDEALRHLYEGIALAAADPVAYTSGFPAVLGDLMAAGGGRPLLLPEKVDPLRLEGDLLRVQPDWNGPVDFVCLMRTPDPADARILVGSWRPGQDRAIDLSRTPGLPAGAWPQLAVVDTRGRDLFPATELLHQR